MSNVQLLVNSQTVEDKLQRMKELSNSIKELEAEYSMLKNDVINSYFNTYEEYRTPTGLLLASYKLSERNQFNSTKFKSDNGDLYAQYTEKKLVATFLLK